ncbi:unnamed protein product [Urochloa humidicola]
MERAALAAGLPPTGAAPVGGLADVRKATIPTDAAANAGDDVPTGSIAGDDAPAAPTSSIPARAAPTQAPAIDDFFTTPTAPMLQHKPIEERKTIEEVLREYVKSIKGPLPDYVIAALSTLLDLDDEDTEQMTEALLQHAGDGVAELQAEQDALLGVTA